MANLMEKYGRQIKVAESFVAENFGKKISDRTRLNTAVLIENTNKFISMRESFATTRTDLGDYKKFCLNLTNISVPSLIANDLVITHALTSFSGSVAYLEYQSRTNKGGVKAGDTFNSVFGLGEMNAARQNFTSAYIVDAANYEAATDTYAALTLSTDAKDIVKGSFAVPQDRVAADGSDMYTGGVVHTNRNNVAYADIKYVVRDAQTKKNHFEYKTVTDPIPAGAIKAIYASNEFQMTNVPAQDIPTIGPVMKNIPLVAEPRRIAVKYDQITAFQAKTDYGFSLDKQIAEQAVGELNYEIDTEIVDMLYQAAKKETLPQELKLTTFSKTLPLGVDMFRHYSSFLNTLSKARTIIYKRTKKFLPNYMVCAPDVLNVLEFVQGYKDTTPNKIYGPYKAGQLNGLAVYVSPLLNDGEYFIGLNGSDMVSSAGVYAPYMAIVPTNLLGTPDGGLAQGFSTYYAKALVNPSLLVFGKIVD